MMQRLKRPPPSFRRVTQRWDTAHGSDFHWKSRQGGDYLSELDTQKKNITVISLRMATVKRKICLRHEIEFGPACRNVGHRCNLIIQRHKIHLYLFVFPQGLGLKESPERYICWTPASYHRGGRETERGGWQNAGLPVTLLPTFNEHVTQQRGQVGDVRKAMYE